MNISFYNNYTFKNGVIPTFHTIEAIIAGDVILHFH